MHYEPVEFGDLPGWTADDHTRAMDAFLQSLDELRKVYPGLMCTGDENARAYFETNFIPHRIAHDAADGFFTGYYEPILKGSRTRSGRFDVPILRRPADLETLIDDRLRASSGTALTHARRVVGGLEAYAERAEIEQGCLDGQGLELLFLDDAVDAFFLHVQGSGVVELQDGECVRIGYAAKNGHPYTSIGQSLIADGIFTAETMNLQALVDWLKADRARARTVLWRNRSYIFFEERGAATDIGPLGVNGIALSEGRSLAVDAGIHAIGLPIFVVIDGLDGVGGGPDFRRLMVAQDVGSAIRGPERGDIFMGSGAVAGQLAGTTKHRGQMFVLLPRMSAAAGTDA